MGGEMKSDGWEAMWANGLPPGAAFDAARVEPALQALIDTDTLPGGNTLVPGCGRGYAVAALAADGTRDVLGIDIAPTAVEEAGKYLKESGSKGSVSVADFFGELPSKNRGHYVLGYDCTFLCAIPIDMRKDWAKAWQSLLRPGGELVTLLFPLPPPGHADPADGHVPGPMGDGPPHYLSQRLAASLLEPMGFELISADEVPEDQLARAKIKSREIIARWKAPGPDAAQGKL